MNRHEARLKFLVPAVSQKGSVNAQGNAKLDQLLFPGFSRGQPGRDGNRSLHDELPGKLSGTMARGDVSDLVRDNGRQFVIVRCRLQQAAIHVDCSTRKAERIDFFRVHDAESVPQCRQ